MRLTKYLAAAAAVVVAGVVAHSAGMFQTLPLLGQGSYCASTIGSGPVQAGPTGFGAGAASPGATGLPLCGQTVPAGPATFAGTEVIPTDLYTPGSVQIAGGPATAMSSVLQYGQGLVFTNTGGASITIPNLTPTFVQPAATAQTITLPSAPIHGQIQRIAVVGAQTTSLTINNNTGQTCTPACPFAAGAATAGTGLAWYYNAPSTQWIKIQ